MNCPSLHPLPSTAAPVSPCLQSEEQLCEQPLEAAGSLGALQLLRRAAANLLRLSWLLALFAPVVLTAPLVGDYLGLSRARWLRLLRWVLVVQVWERVGQVRSAGAAAGRRPPPACSVTSLLPCPLLLDSAPLQVDPGAGGAGVHKVGAVGSHAARPLPSRLLR